MREMQQILIVDDDHDILSFLSSLLELEGYQVQIADNGLKALAWLESNTPNLILLDIAMPGIDGIQVLQHIRQHTNVPILMITANHEMNTLQKALNNGADDYIRKPFSAVVIAARIKSKLRRTKVGHYSAN